MTAEFTESQLDTVPSALDDQPRHPNTEDAALEAIAEGAERIGPTADDVLAAAPGWQHHTVRGAISGALRKRLGLTVEAVRTREVGPNKSGAEGGATVYRIPGSSPRTA